MQLQLSQSCMRDKRCLYLVSALWDSKNFGVGHAAAVSTPVVAIKMLIIFSIAGAFYPSTKFSSLSNVILPICGRHQTRYRCMLIL